MKKERFFGSRAMGRHGPVKLAVLTGRHGTEKWPVGRALGQRRGTSMAVARHGRHGGPCRHDAGPSRHGPMAIYIRVVRGNAEAQKPNEFASSRFFLLWVRPSAIQTGPNK